jgi:hypothetical protein
LDFARCVCSFSFFLGANVMIYVRESRGDGAGDSDRRPMSGDKR